VSAGSLQRSGVRLVKTATPGIYKKGNRYVVVFRDPSGRQRKRSARTLAEARTLKAALTADVKRSEYVAESRVSFVDYARRWIDTYDGRTARGVRESTLHDYRRALGLDEQGEPTGGGAVAYFGHMPLAAIRPHDMKGYAAHEAARGVARNTVRLALAPVKALLATAHEEGLTRSNVAVGLRLGRTVAASPVKQTQALNEEQVVQVLAQVPQPYQLLAEFLAQTGLRISEALALQKGDIDFGRRRVSVSKRLYKGRLDAPKSRHGIRQVPLSPEHAQRLWTLLAIAEENTLVFARADGRPFDPTAVYRAVRAAGERAGIEWPVGPHTFGHSCASIMFRRGVPKEAIRRMPGHHSWEFTAGTYLHLDNDDLPDGAVVGDLLADVSAERMRAVEQQA
jgi:integrase